MPFVRTDTFGLTDDVKSAVLIVTTMHHVMARPVRVLLDVPRVGMATCVANFVRYKTVKNVNKFMTISIAKSVKMVSTGVPQIPIVSSVQHIVRMDVTFWTVLVSTAARLVTTVPSATVSAAIVPLCRVTTREATVHRAVRRAGLVDGVCPAVPYTVEAAPIITTAFVAHARRAGMGRSANQNAAIHVRGTRSITSSTVTRIPACVRMDVGQAMQDSFVMLRAMRIALRIFAI